jgi:hypothetical protein
LSFSSNRKAIQRDPAPTLTLIEDLAERTWKANIEFERRILQLEREKKDLARAMNHVWTGFDSGIASMACVDDSLFPLHEKLVKIYSSLRTLVASGQNTLNYSAALIKLQQKLNDLVCCMNLMNRKTNIASTPSTFPLAGPD